MPVLVSVEGCGGGVWLGSALADTLLAAQTDRHGAPGQPATRHLSPQAACSWCRQRDALEPAHGSLAPVLSSSAPLQSLSPWEGSALPGTSLFRPLLHMGHRPRKSCNTDAVFRWPVFFWSFKQSLHLFFLNLLQFRDEFKKQLIPIHNQYFNAFCSLQEAAQHSHHKGIHLSASASTHRKGATSPLHSVPLTAPQLISL